MRMDMGDSVRVFPGPAVAGTLRMPGDKSISHRAAMLAALSGSTVQIEGFLESEDCLNTLKAVLALGAGVAHIGGGRVTVHGTGGRFSAPAGVLDMGNSGTGMRLLAGLLAGHAFTAELTGDESLRSRPMKRIKDPLERMGARVELTGERGCAPVRITGGSLRAIEYVMPMASAQVKSCVLLAGLFADGTTAVVEPQPSRDHTELMFRAAGIPVEVNGPRVSVAGFGPKGPAFKLDRVRVPGDFSSAAFWLGAAACRPGSRVAVEGVGLNPRRTALLDVLARMGARIEIRPEAAGGAGEPAGTIEVVGGRLRATEVGGAEIANVIDELPLIASIAALADGTTVIRDAAELRVKETDRISVMAGNLAALGVEIAERRDGMEIAGRGGRPVRGGARVGSRGDHRIAMCMAVLALCAERPVEIDGTACIATSYPTFWRDLEEVGGRAEPCDRD